MKAYPVNFTVIIWEDNLYSFTVSNVGSEDPFFMSHTWDYPLYTSIGDVIHAIEKFESGRAKVRGCPVETLIKNIIENTIVATGKVEERERDQAAAAERDALLKPAQMAIPQKEELRMAS